MENPNKLLLKAGLALGALGRGGICPSGVGQVTEVGKGLGTPWDAQGLFSVLCLPGLHVSPVNLPQLSKWAARSWLEFWVRWEV